MITVTENFDVERMLTPVSDNMVLNLGNYGAFFKCFV